MERAKEQFSWGIGIEGRDHDLELLLVHAPHPFSPNVTMLRDEKFGDEYLFKAKELEVARSPTEALEIGKKLLLAFNSIAKAKYRCASIDASGVVVQFENEKPIAMSAILQGVSGEVAIQGGYFAPTKDYPSEIQSVFNAITDVKEKTSVFHRLKEADDWDSIYRAFEAIKDEFPHPKLPNMRQKLNLSSSETSRFTNSCNQHRHHQEEVVRNPMSLKEAQTFLFSVAIRWMTT